MFSVEKLKAGASCQLFAGADGTGGWIFKGWIKRRGPLVCCCVQVGVFGEGLFCRDRLSFQTCSDLCECAVCPAVLLQSLAEDVPMAFFGDGLDLFSVFQWNFFN